MPPPPASAATPSSPSQADEAGVATTAGAQCCKAEAKKNLDVGAATVVFGVAVLLGCLCLPQDAKHTGKLRLAILLLLSFATFLSGKALVLLSLSMLGLREGLVSGSGRQRTASKCLLVACTVLSVLALLSLLEFLLDEVVYIYVGLAVVVVVLLSTAGPHWYLRRRALGGGEAAAYEEQREELAAASKITSCITNSAFGGLIGVLFSTSKCSGAAMGVITSAADVAIFLMFITATLGMFVLSVSKKAPEITNLQFRQFLVAATRLANAVLLSLLASAVFAAAFVVWN